MSLIISMKC